LVAGPKRRLRFSQLSRRKLESRFSGSGFEINNRTRSGLVSLGITEDPNPRILAFRNSPRRA
jgi:hypothetical protein